MHNLAVLAPALDEATPAERTRALRALMEQMMLLACGLPVDSPAVRRAAAMVGSALAPEPTEYELGSAAVRPRRPASPPPFQDVSGPGPRSRATGVEGRPAARLPSKSDNEVPAAHVEHQGAVAGWQLSPTYARYLRTIMSTSPA
jgi:hypothetical protein